MVNLTWDSGYFGSFPSNFFNSSTIDGHRSFQSFHSFNLDRHVHFTSSRDVLPKIIWIFSQHFKASSSKLFYNFICILIKTLETTHAVVVDSRNSFRVTVDIHPLRFVSFYSIILVFFPPHRQIDGKRTRSRSGTPSGEILSPIKQ